MWVQQTVSDCISNRDATLCCCLCYREVGSSDRSPLYLFDDAPVQISNKRWSPHFEKIRNTCDPNLVLKNKKNKFCMTTTEKKFQVFLHQHYSICTNFPCFVRFLWSRVRIPHKRCVKIIQCVILAASGFLKDVDGVDGFFYFFAIATLFIK